MASGIETAASTAFFLTHIVRRVLGERVEVRGLDGHRLAVGEGLERSLSSGGAHPALTLAAQPALGVHAAQREKEEE